MINEDLIRRLVDLDRRLSSVEQTLTKPAFVDWTHVALYLGFSTAPTGGYQQYMLLGRLCLCFVGMGTYGTSNAPNYQIRLPFRVRGGHTFYGTIHYGKDNYANLVSPGIVVAQPGYDYASLYKDVAMTPWTDVGQKGANFFLAYEIE